MKKLILISLIIFANLNFAQAKESYTKETYTKEKYTRESYVKVRPVKYAKRAKRAKCVKPAKKVKHIARPYNSSRPLRLKIIDLSTGTTPTKEYKVIDLSRNSEPKHSKRMNVRLVKPEREIVERPRVYRSAESYKVTELDLTGTAEIDVEPDSYNAVLHVKVSGDNGLAELQTVVNKKMRKARDLIMWREDFSVTTKGYDSNRDYYSYTDAFSDKPRWVVSQKIEIDTQNKSELFDVIGELEAEGFELDKLTGYFSEAGKAAYKNKLIEEALDQIENHARSVADSLGKSTVKFTEVTIQSTNLYNLRSVKVDMKSAIRDKSLSLFDSAYSESVLDAPNKTATITLSAKVTLR